ncbi:MAG TPA: hypothetical protein VJH25_00975, partial [Candidatus Paceibacterota bacterium]
VAGEIVELDPVNPVFVSRATKTSSMPILGVVSTAPGFWLGGFNDELYPDDIKLPIALAGRVPLKVNNEGGAISVGDRITLSGVSGVGMKQTTSGETIGIALENTSDATDTIEVFMNLKNNNITSQFNIDSTGSIGIGTTSPEYKLHVIGDIAATSFVNISTREAKKDISYLNEEDRGSILSKIKNVGIAQYRYTEESGGNPLRLGLIAEEAPSEVLAIGGKGVDVYKLSTFILAGVQELDRRFVTLETQVVEISNKLASTTAQLVVTEAKLAELEAIVTASGASTFTGFSSTSTSTATSTVEVTWSNNMASSVVSFFTGLGTIIENGVAKFVAIIADSITARTVVVNTLTVGSPDNLSASGIIIYDRQTGAPTCMYVANGVIQSELGVCGATNTISTGQGTISEVAPSAPTIEPTPEPTPEIISEPIVEPIPEVTPTLESMTESVVETITESVSETVPETTVMSEPAVVETTPEPVVEITPVP